MRIVHVVPDVANAGNGIINCTVDLACEQSRQGHQVSVASGGGGWEDLLHEYGVRNIRLDISRKPATLSAAVRQLRRVAEHDADVLHAHTITAAVLARSVASLTGKPLVTTSHNEFARSAPLMGIGNRVIAVSHAVARELERRRVPGRKIRVVRNGTLGGARAQADSVLPPEHLEHPAVVTVAGMYYRKGIAELIDAFTDAAKDVPDAHLYVVGDGPDRAAFEAKARATPAADRIVFTGYQPATRRYLEAADVFVLASRRDPMPMVIPEARDAGCAIIASDADGIPEALDYGRAGYVFPAGDVDAMADGLRTLLTDETERARWAAAAKDNVAWLRVERVAIETVDVYREVVAGDG